MHKRIRPKDIAYSVYRCVMSLDDASDLLRSASSALTCCLEMMSSEPSDVCCASAMHIVRDFCTDFIPENIEEQGCTVCGQLSLVEDMRSLNPAIHNLDVLRSPNSQVERFEAVDPIQLVEGPLLAPRCDSVCDRCHESKMPLCRVKRDSFLPHEVMARSH